MSYITILANHNYLEDNIRSLVKISKNTSLDSQSTTILSLPEGFSPVAEFWYHLVSLIRNRVVRRTSLMHFGDEVYSILSSFSVLSISHRHRIQFHQILRDLIFLSHMILRTTLEISFVVILFRLRNIFPLLKSLQCLQNSSAYNQMSF